MAVLLVIVVACFLLLGIATKRPLLVEIVMVEKVWIWYRGMVSLV